MSALLVALGAAVGAPLRWAVGELAARRGSRLPRGTLAVNVAGSLLLGALVGAGAGGGALLLLGTGFCGALTTFSTLSAEAVRLLEDGDRAAAAAYVVLSLVLGVAAAAAGAALGGALA
ncbi:FluC/FEX family fluoride channel [Vallicoccus soli]|uniref:Fluoride-specific ion channel FluC n=1 Tax=Vallicoccus soli TaxID=2339232 RepID=A0A3A3ZIS6_9ACTN|nr:CrcB family protein [Vallicoccus soli]RJK95436.1 CrcB family protein [Vallicoccus soli]